MVCYTCLAVVLVIVSFFDTSETSPNPNPVTIGPKFKLKLTSQNASLQQGASHDCLYR